MPVQHRSRQLEITVSESLYQWLSHEAQRRAQHVSTVVQVALEQYAQQFDLTQTRTWELCGTLAVAEPEPEYIVGLDEAGDPTTGYAEYVDDVLYKGA